MKQVIVKRLVLSLALILALLPVDTASATIITPPPSGPYTWFAGQCQNYAGSFTQSGPFQTGPSKLPVSAQITLYFCDRAPRSNEVFGAGFYFTDQAAFSYKIPYPPGDSGTVQTGGPVPAGARAICLTVKDNQRVWCAHVVWSPVTGHPSIGNPMSPWAPEVSVPAPLKLSTGTPGNPDCTKCWP